MNIFAVADTHLSFGEKIDKPMDIFGSIWKDYEVRLKENWEKVVEPSDLVLIPGDISWAMKFEDAKADLKWIDNLPGKKLLLKGNHDLWWASMKKMKGSFPSIFFLQNDAYVDEKNLFAIIGSRGWLCPADSNFKKEDEKIYQREILRIKMSIEDYQKKINSANVQRDKFQLFAMTHFPPTAPNKEETEFTKLFKEAGVKRAVYGHLHSAKAFENGPKGLFNGVEYMLVSLDSLNAKLQIVGKI